MDEIWKDVKGFEGRFKISNFGRILSINGKYKGEKILSPTIGDRGYYTTSLRKTPLHKVVRIHVLVAEAFLPIPHKLQHSDKRICVNHKDGNKLNNHVSNLEWVTDGQNADHAWANGLINTKGSNSPNAKLTESEVLHIRELSKQGLNSVEIATMLNGKVQRRHIVDIVNRVNWKHI